MGSVFTSKQASVAASGLTDSALADQRLEKLDLPRFDPRMTYGHLLRLAESSPDRNDFLLSLLQHAVSVSHALGAAYFVATADDRLQLGPRLMSRELLRQNPDAMAVISDNAVDCRQKGYSLTTELDDAQGARVFLSPVSVADGRKEVICLVFGGIADIDAPWALFLQILGGFVNLWEGDRLNRSLHAEADFTSGLVEIISQVNGPGEREKILIHLADQLKAFSGSDRVAVGLRATAKSGVELAQLSGTDQVKETGEFYRLLTLCFEESANYGEIIRLPDVHSNWEQGLFGGHRQFCRFTRSAALLSVPLNPSDGDTVGVLVFWWLDALPDPGFEHRLPAASEPLGNALSTLVDKRKGIHRGAMSGAKRGAAKLFGMLFLAAVALAMMVPVAHRIDSDVLVRPVKQRTISTSFDALLDEVLVKPGDVVAAGDVLARFDGQELQWKLDALEADYLAAKKLKDTRVAERDTQAAQLARLDMERIGLDIALVKSQISQLEVVSPIDGIVLSGDLEQKRGSLIAKGSPVFEVAPLGQVSAEVRIPVQDYAYMAPGLPMEILFDALPGASWSAELGRIQPRATVLDAETVFLVRVDLDNDNLDLRPGMKGKASVVKDKKPLGWVLFHKAYFQFRVWFRAKFGW